jgi:hypothetical protein
MHCLLAARSIRGGNVSGQRACKVSGNRRAAALSVMWFSRNPIHREPIRDLGEDC